MNHLATFIIAAIIAVIFVAVVINAVKKNRNGGCSCSGGCSGCSGRCCENMQKN